MERLNRWYVAFPFIVGFIALAIYSLSYAQEVDYTPKQRKDLADLIDRETQEQMTASSVAKMVILYGK